MSTSAALERELEIDLWLQPKQEALWELVDESPYTDIGFGGSRGAGKSGAARRILIARRLKYEGTPGLILRRTFQELYDNHLVPLLDEFPMLRPWWDAGHKQVVFPNGSRLRFGYAEHEDDVKKYVGSEFGDICPEEAALFSQKELEMLKGSCRWSRHPSFTAKMIYPFMPGGPGHFYLKRIFYDRDYEGQEKAEQYAFIPARGWDNVEWSRPALLADGLTAKDYYQWTDLQRRQYFITRSDYGRKLDGLADKQLREAWLDGSMEITEGVVFPELREPVHNLDNFISDDRWYEFCANLKKIGSIDHASSGVTAYVQEGYSHESIKFSLEEYYERNKTVAQHAGSILSVIERYGEQDRTLIDPSTEAKTLQGKNPQTNQDELWSVLDEYRRNGVSAFPANRSQVSTGLDVLKDLLRVDPLRVHAFTGRLGAPSWFISKKRCPNLWREVRELQRVFSATGTWEFVGSDHALDDARYIAMSRPQPPKRKQDVKPEHIMAAGRKQTSIDWKAARSLSKFDKKFGKSQTENEWFPRD